jgi:putative intracellular protease/amidase
MLAALMSQIWGYVAGAAALVAVAGGLYLRGRSAGKATERAENDAKRFDNMQEARHVENEIRAAGPDTARERLRMRQSAARKQ